MISKVSAQVFLIATVILTSLTSIASQVTTSTQDLDNLFNQRAAQSRVLALLTLVVSGQPVEYTEANLKLLNEIKYWEKATGLQPWRDSASIVECPKSKAQLCFGKEMIQHSRILARQYVRSISRVDATYETALSIVSKDQLSARHLQEIKDRPARKAKSDLVVATLEKEIDQRGMASYKSLNLALMLFIAAGVFLTSFVWLAVATAATASSIPIAIVLLGLIATGSGGVAYTAKGIHEIRTSGISQVEQQLRNELKNNEKLQEKLYIDDQVLEILNKATAEKSPTETNKAMP